MASYTVVIPNWLPTTVNQLLNCHWAAAGRRKKADKQMVAYYCRAAGVAPATGKRRVALTLVMGHRMRAPDPDSSHKSLLDALVACGALRNDNKENVELVPVVFERAKVKSTRVVLEDVESCD